MGNKASKETNVRQPEPLQQFKIYRQKGDGSINDNKLVHIVRKQYTFSNVYTGRTKAYLASGDLKIYHFVNAGPGNPKPDTELKKMKIALMSSGPSDTFYIIDNNNVLYGFGQNINWAKKQEVKIDGEYDGIFGPTVYSCPGTWKNFIISIPIPIPFGYTHKVIKIASGSNFSIFLLNDGLVFGVGANIGFTEVTRYVIKTPIKIRIENIKDISCGDQHVLCLKSDGGCIGFGNNYNGQLADINNPVVFAPNAMYTYMENFQRKRRHFNQDGKTNRPTEIHYFKSHYISVKSIYTWMDNSAIMDSCGDVYTFGSNRNGQLANGKSAEYHTPYPVPSLVKLPVDDDIYEIVVFGYCRQYILPLLTSNTIIPASIQNICVEYYYKSKIKETVEQIVVGGSTFVLCSNGHIYACGSYTIKDHSYVYQSSWRRVNKLLEFDGKVVKIVKGNGLFFFVK